MTAPGFRKVLSTIALMLGILGCTDETPVRQVPEERPHVMVAPSPRDPDEMLARRAFERFLQLAVATNAPRLGRYDSVYTCRDNELDEDVRWLAEGRVVALGIRGDTADVAAVLTTVAHQVIDDIGEGYTATIRVRDDTAHWRVVRSDGTGWKVCGDAKEHFGIMMLGRDIKWLPAGASPERAHALIDSIRRSRGLPIVR